jgi:hypothetical protein
MACILLDSQPDASLALRFSQYPLEITLNDKPVTAPAPGNLSFSAVGLAD